MKPSFWRRIGEMLSWAYMPELAAAKAQADCCPPRMEHAFVPDLTWSVDGQETKQVDLGDVFQDRGAVKHILLKNTSGRHLREVVIHLEESGGAVLREPWLRGYGNPITVEHLGPGETKQLILEIPTWMPLGRHAAKVNAKGDFGAAPHVSKFSKWESYG